MLKNYLRIAFRNLSRNRLSSAINIGGLAIGMAVAILISLWIYNETTYNHQYRNHSRIAAVLQNQVFNGQIDTWNGQAWELGPELKTGYSDYFKHIVMASYTGDHLLSFDDKKIKTNGNYMGAEVLDMLSAKMLQGSYTALQDPSSVVLSASTARSIFGGTDPMGKTLIIDGKLPVKVTGIYEDLPDNSDYEGLKFIVPWQLLMSSKGYEKQLGWGNSWFQTLVQLNDNITMQQASAAIKDLKLHKGGPGNARFKPELFLHPLDRWHLHGEFKNGTNTSGGAIQYVRLFSLIGAFVLLLACINFMNLSTARSEKRAKEVGIRKAIGSLRGQLIGQFFSESVLIAVFSFLLAIGLAQLMLPFFNEVSGKKMSILWGQPFFWLTAIGFTLLTGIIAGSYPALYLSSFRPVKVLKGTFRVGRLASVPRKVLVVLQFTVSVILIIGTIAVFRQIQYVKDRPVGYSRDGLVMLSVKSDALRNHYEAFRNDVLRTGAVEEMALSESPLTAVYITNSGYTWQGKDPAMTDDFSTVKINPEYGKVTRWQIVEGRDFNRDLATDSLSFVINEAAVKYMGLKDPVVGQRIKWGDNGNYTIIGVVKDMIMQSPFEPARQTIFYEHAAFVSNLNVIDVRIRPDVGTAAALDKIASIYKKYDSENPFEYQFVDQQYAKKFSSEERVGKLAGFFTSLAIFISCLGLFGLASFVAEQRTREIGVRKVLGASILNLWQLLSKEFVRLVMLSLLIGGPIAWWVMHNWLQNYHYHATLSWWIFALAGSGAVVITLLTVSFQAIKAAMANPVKSLRTE
jgi:putative ABC transport system permease protein